MLLSQRETTLLLAAGLSILPKASWVNCRSFLETAKVLTQWDNALGINDFEWEKESLCRKKNGKFFLYGEGEPASPYATDHDTARKPGPWSEGEDIIPFTTDQAKQWAEKKLDPDKYEKIFGKVPEDNEVITEEVQFDRDDWEKVHKIAEKKGLAVDKLIQKAIVIHLPKWFI